MQRALDSIDEALLAFLDLVIGELTHVVHHWVVTDTGFNLDHAVLLGRFSFPSISFLLLSLLIISSFFLPVFFG